MVRKGLRGKGMLMVFSEVKRRDERDFNEWYNREHIDERVSLPGFRRARRYVAISGGPKYLATYECAKVTSLSQAGYLKALARQSSWSRRVMRRFTTFERFTMRIRVDLAHGVGGVMTCVRFVPEPKQTRALTEWLKAVALPSAVGQAGLVGGYAAENVLEIANAPTHHSRSVYSRAEDVEWAVVLEGSAAAATAAAARRQLNRKVLAPYGVRLAPVVGTYQLAFGNER